MALWLCPVSVCWEVMLNFLKISEKSRLFDCFWHVDSAGSSRIYRCTMNHTTSRMITEVAMAMTSHIAAIVGKGVSLRGFTVSQDHCHDSKLSLSNHIKPYQSISIHQTPSNAFKRVQGPWTLAVKVPESFCHRSSGFEALRPLESGARSDFLEHSLCYLAWWQAASSIKPVI